MTTEELCANLTKACDIICEASKKLWATSSDLPEDLEINVARVPIAAATARDAAETLEYMRYYLLIDEDGNKRQFTSEELEKICATICKHLWLVRDLLEDVLYDPAIADNKYGADLWVLSMAIVEMVGKFQPKGEE